MQTYEARTAEATVLIQLGSEGYHSELIARIIKRTTQDTRHAERRKVDALNSLAFKLAETANGASLSVDWTKMLAQQFTVCSLLVVPLQGCDEPSRLDHFVWQSDA